MPGWGAVVHRHSVSRIQEVLDKESVPLFLFVLRSDPSVRASHVPKVPQCRNRRTGPRGDSQPLALHPAQIALIAKEKASSRAPRRAPDHLSC